MMFIRRINFPLYFVFHLSATLTIKKVKPASMLTLHLQTGQTSAFGLNSLQEEGPQSVQMSVTD